jgi:hypothetical protein
MNSGRRYSPFITSIIGIVQIKKLKEIIGRKKLMVFFFNNSS